MKAKVRLESILGICLKNKKEDELHIRVTPMIIKKELICLEFELSVE